MKIKGLLVLGIVLVIGSFAFTENISAADVYITQTAGGSDNGASCTDAHSIAWLNTAGNWANPKQAGKVGPGDTVHLCGTLTTALTIQGSGSSGSPITILFEPDAKFSSPVWSSSGAISGSGESYIIIDGGSGGIIENTDSGSAAGGYGSQQGSQAIRLDMGPHDIGIRNLIIQNMYVRTDPGDFSDGARGTGGIYYYGGSNFSVHDCLFDYVPRSVDAVGSGAMITGWSFYNNNVTNGHTGFVIAPCTVNGNIYGVLFHDNIINLGPHWSFNDDSDQWHAESVHTHTDCAAGSRIDNARFYNNVFGPQTPMKASASASTAWLYLEARQADTLIYNNLFLIDPGYGPTNGVIAVSYRDNSDGMKIYNNVIIGSSSEESNAIDYGNSGDEGLEIKNNLIEHIRHGIYIPDGLSLSSKSQIDYNVYYDVNHWGTGFGSWSEWNAQGYESHSTNGFAPSLDADYVPTSSDTVVKDKGVSLSSYFTTDKHGVTRPQGSGWDIGAYEYVSGTATSTCTSDADTDGDSVVSNEELISYISQWESGTVTIGDLIAVIDEWKNGC